MNPLEPVIARAIWNVDLNAMPTWRAWLTRAARILHAVVNDVIEGQLGLRAMSLVYTTLLSLVPLLAVSFSVLKGFGVHNQLEPLLAQFLAPLGEQGAEITTNVIGFVENMKVGVLGSVGLGLLLYTVVSLVQKIESSFNYAWHTAQTRTLGQRFANYLSVIMVGPVLMFAAMGLTATVMSHTVVQRLAEIEPFGLLIQSASELLPYGLVIAAFAFVYGFVPNTHVRPRSAIVGAVIAGVLWETAGWLFASFVVGSAKYTAIYSGFAILLFFMIWLYVSWLILLVGASIAFYVQHPEHVTAHRGELSLSNQLKEKLALLAMTRIAQAHRAGDEPWTLDRLAHWLGIRPDALGLVVHALCDRGLLVETAAEPVGYVPLRAPETLPVAEVLRAVRSAEETPQLNSARLPAEGAVDSLVQRIEDAVAGSLENQTLDDLSR